MTRTVATRLDLSVVPEPRRLRALEAEREGLNLAAMIWNLADDDDDFLNLAILDLLRDIRSGNKSALILRMAFSRLADALAAHAPDRPPLDIIDVVTPRERVM